MTTESPPTGTTLPEEELEPEELVLPEELVPPEELVLVDDPVDPLLLEVVVEELLPPVPLDPQAPSALSATDTTNPAPSQSKNARRIVHLAAGGKRIQVGRRHPARRGDQGIPRRRALSFWQGRVSGWWSSTWARARPRCTRRTTRRTRARGWAGRTESP